LAEGGTHGGGGDYIEGMQRCLPQVINSFQNYRRVATTFYPTLVEVFFERAKGSQIWFLLCVREDMTVTKHTFERP
jgi:hypothetical protein